MVDESVEQPKAEEPKQQPQVKGMSYEEMRVFMTKKRIEQWNSTVRQVRLQKLKNRGYQFDPCVELTDEELKALVPLPGDKLEMRKIARDKHGLILPPPKVRGPKKHHFTGNQNSIKSHALQRFRKLFNSKAAKLAQEAAEKNEQFNGIPQDDIPKLGARATVLGTQDWNRKKKDRKRRKRRQQDLSRRINYGLMPGNTNTRRYMS